MRIEYTDNLFLTPDNRNEEMIASYGPTLKMKNDGKNLQMALDYRYERFEYLDEPELNDSKERHLGTLNGVLFPENNLSVGLKGDARVESLDRRLSDATDLQTVNTANRYQGQVRPTYRFGRSPKFSGELAYQYEIVDYNNEIAVDTESHRGEVTLNFGTTSRTKWFTSAFFERFDIEQRRGFDRINALGGCVWSPGNALRLKLAGGGAHFDFEDDRWHEAVLVDSSMRLTMTSGLALELAGRRDFEYDITDGLYLSIQGEGSLSMPGRFSWKLGSAYRHDKFVEVNRDDRELGIMAELNYQATPRVLLRLLGGVRHLEFEPIAEKADRGRVETAVEYSLGETTRLGCSYTYRQNDSDIDSNDYTENRAYCDASFAFGLVR